MINNEVLMNFNTIWGWIIYTPVVMVSMVIIGGGLCAMLGLKFNVK